MNRCGPPSSSSLPAAARSARLSRRAAAQVLCAAGLFATGTARSQTRPFPESALRGRLRIVAPPQVQIDGRDAQLAPGARILNAQNMLVMSGTLIGQELAVNYLRDPATGLIGDVWLLSPEEAAVKRRGAEQPSWFGSLFGS